MKKLRITTSTSPDEWPVLLNKHEVALLLDRSVRTLEDQCRAGTVVPAPIADAKGDFRKPYHWNRAVVRRFIEGEPVPARGLRRAS